MKIIFLKYELNRAHKTPLELKIIKNWFWKFFPSGVLKLGSRSLSEKIGTHWLMQKKICFYIFEWYCFFKQLVWHQRPKISILADYPHKNFLQRKYSEMAQKIWTCWLALKMKKNFFELFHTKYTSTYMCNYIIEIRKNTYSSIIIFIHKTKI